MPLDNIAPKPTATLKQPEVPLTPPPEGNPANPVNAMQIEQVLEMIAQYNQFGKALKRDRTMQEVGGQLAQIAELAEQAVVNEAGDWYDAHTVKRNMKEIKGYAGDFLKLATEADAINQRMTALYDDMGRVLERYFEIPNDLIDPDDAVKTPNQIPNQAGTGTVDGPQELEEGPDKRGTTYPFTTKGGHKGITGVNKNGASRHFTDSNQTGASKFASDTTKHPTNHKDLKKEGDMPSPTKDQLPAVEERDKAAVDKLTLKAIKLVHTRLKQKNPEQAQKFAALPARKKIELVWQLVK